LVGFTFELEVGRACNSSIHLVLSIEKFIVHPLKLTVIVTDGKSQQGRQEAAKDSGSIKDKISNNNKTCFDFT
jgi:hypothetical protein